MYCDKEDFDCMEKAMFYRIGNKFMCRKCNEELKQILD